MIQVDIRRKLLGQTVLLGPIRFDVARGETVAVTGPSGIGKTTLLRLIAGIDRSFEGGITRPHRMAIAFQEPTLLPWRSVIENLTLVHPSLSRDDALAELNAVGLKEKYSLFPGQLSLGQQRRLSLARAFAGQPDLLLMDEPFVSLDAETAETMFVLTEQLLARHQPATVLVTHSTEEAERFADRILKLRHGSHGAILETI